MFSPIPARMAATGVACAISPIPKNKKKTEIMKRKSVSIDKNLNFVFPLFFMFTSRIVRANRVNRAISVITMLEIECTPELTRIPTRIRSMISIMSSRVPIPIMLCPSFVFMILNSSRIGIRIASPTVAKDRATREDTSQE